MIVIEKWGGIVTNASPYALPGGACVSQSNLQCVKPGQLQSRGGMAYASAQIATLSASPVVAAVRMAGVSTERILFHAGSYISVVNVT